MWFPCSEIDKCGGIQFFGPKKAYIIHRKSRFPWSESDKFGVIKAEVTGKAHHKCQISRKCFGKFFASSLRFMIFLRPGTEERNTQINITWFPSPEIDKTGGSNFFGPSKAYIKRQNIGKRSGTIFTSILRFFVLFLRHGNGGISLPPAPASTVVKRKESYQETALSQAQKPFRNPCLFDFYPVI